MPASNGAPASAPRPDNGEGCTPLAGGTRPRTAPAGNPAASPTPPIGQDSRAEGSGRGAINDHTPLAGIAPSGSKQSGSRRVETAPAAHRASSPTPPIGQDSRAEGTGRRRQSAAWAALAAGSLLLALACYPSLWDKQGQGVFKLDAWIYYHAVAHWAGGGNLYQWWAFPDSHDLPFTYPPFAAATFTPLLLGSDRTAQVLLTLATPIAVVVTIWAVLRVMIAGRCTRPSSRTIADGGTHPSAHGSAGGAPAWLWAGAVWVALGAVVVIEPVYKTMEYGQINAILMALIVVDALVVPAGSRARGVLSAVAACVKLTPAIAVLYFLARREWRAAATMVGSALAITGACWAAWPAESADFFLHAMWDPSRAGNADYAGNQNLKAIFARLLPEAPGVVTLLWMLASLLVIAGLALLLHRLEQVRLAGGGASRSALTGRPHDPAGPDSVPAHQPSAAGPLPSCPRTGTAPASTSARSDAGGWTPGNPLLGRPQDATGKATTPANGPSAEGAFLTEVRDDVGNATGLQASRSGILSVLELAAVGGAGLLVSPISWSHHWVWAVPMLLSLTAAAASWRDARAGWSAAAGAATFALAMHWWLPETQHVEATWPWWAKIIGASYTLWAIGAGATLTRAARHWRNT